MDVQMALESVGATTFDFAASEAEAVNAALAHRPAVITSDVKLREGTGPAAVRRIRDELGDIATIFITGLPEACIPCDPPDVILAKPFQHERLKDSFAQLAPR